jgi:hypothetical protein
MKQNLRGGYGGNPPNVRSSFMSASDIAKRIKLLEEQNKRKPQKATKEQLESGRVTENRDGTLTFNKLPGDPGYHDPSEGYTYRKNIGWTTGEEAQERFNAARDKYDAKMGMTGFRKAVQGLTDVADLAAKLPIVNSAAKQIYKTFAPPTSEYYSGGSLSTDPSYALTGREMKEMLPDATLHCFKDLRNIRSIYELLGAGKTAIILYELQPGNGHWTLVFERPDGVIECFDSLGYVPDDEIGFIPKRFREESQQENTHLLNLLANVKSRIEYNEKELQKNAPGVNSCGRWVIYRIMHKNLSIKKFQEYVKKNKIDDEVISKIIVGNLAPIAMQ